MRDEIPVTKSIRIMHKSVGWWRQCAEEVCSGWCRGRHWDVRERRGVINADVGREDECSGRLKMQDWKMRHQIARVENAEPRKYGKPTNTPVVNCCSRQWLSTRFMWIKVINLLLLLLTYDTTFNFLKTINTTHFPEETLLIFSPKNPINNCTISKR